MSQEREDDKDAKDFAVLREAGARAAASGWPRARALDEMSRAALQAAEGRELAKLSELHRQGWRPIEDSGCEWLKMAMRETSGQAMLWGLENAPEEVLRSPYWTRAIRAESGSSKDWSALSMAAIEMAALDIYGASAWFNLALHARAGEKYLLEAFGSPSAWMASEEASKSVFSALAEKFDRLSSRGEAIESAVVDLMARVAVSFRPVEGACEWHCQAGGNCCITMKGWTEAKPLALSVESEEQLVD